MASTARVGGRVEGLTGFEKREGKRRGRVVTRGPRSVKLTKRGSLKSALVTPSKVHFFGVILFQEICSN